ncbi:sigma factor, partial [Paenibacillus dakarensis]|uniref:sigma factor n=1 Tax=Paenibacillus dakarensis TaxID=1527293 RepID=UPI00247FC4E4
MDERKSAPLNHADLWAAWKEDGDQEAKKKLIENHLHIVDYVSSRLAIGLPRNISKGDLASNGVMGLIDAIEKFDYKRGLQFETYASWRVRG